MTNYHKGITFDPGAEIFCPERGVVPLTAATGTGYIPARWGISPLQPYQDVKGQVISSRGIGVETGSVGFTSGLVADSDGTSIDGYSSGGANNVTQY